MIESSGMTGHPATLLAELRSRPTGSCLALSFSLSQYWLPGTPAIDLHALCLRDGDDLLCVITDNGRAIEEATQENATLDRTGLAQIAADSGTSIVNLAAPLPLETVRIDKPWGAEIWYTGIEKRGVCLTGETPLPWVTGLAGELCYGSASPELVLLKILDPFPEPVYGDLYFEMHEQKIEVYVVTQVHPDAWPEGTGAIRFGFDSAKTREFVSLESFKEAWLDSVNAYREIRSTIDEIFDEFRHAEGIPHDAVVEPARVEQWKQRLDDELNANEEAHREAMNAFTSLKPLNQGDVVRVPPFTPHSLQHGVRVVEFQTPHYERHILSFAQKVLTQPHWDTAEAADKIDWQATFDTSLETLERGEHYHVDQVADFEAFEVRRIHLQPGVRYRTAISTYAIVMAIGSPIVVNGLKRAPEQACLVPAILPEVTITPAAETGCFALLALPKTPGRGVAGRDGRPGLRP